MKITKHEHACLSIEGDGGTLVIDPGSFSGRLVDLEDVRAVVITHEHPDHWTPEHVADLRARFPHAPLYGPAGLAAAVAGSDAGDVIEVVAPGDEREVGGFRLEFFGGVHAEIHRTMPRVDNVGVLVDGRLYHPGDSLEGPAVPVEVLATPVSGPWLKVGEAMDFVMAVAPQHAIAIHDALLSEAGLRLSEGRVAAAVESVGGSYVQLRAGDAFTP
ncbi:MBL fold metallo-hydrolase [Pseudactinotalea suaedae]|uniref:MBL fold metallo-hydrolase n=1 Tax=Pseudactinotalea suaedae TaxID=1524924 RepID=UPI0012E25037|nr:MBL fold metallo-hydrolase [Pseudactinotalea suaedae]